MCVQYSASSFVQRQPSPTPMCSERPKGAIAAAIGARLRDVLPLRTDEAAFADLLAALELVPATRPLH